MDAFNSYAKRHPFAEDINEATSGIGGAYTTKAIDMIPTGTKVKKIQEIAKVNASTALKTLLECNWKVKEAILMLQCNLTQPEAQEALRKNCGVLRRTLANLAKA